MPNKIISIIGKPNVGKSSLFNLISGNHIAAETSKPHTTRHLIDSNISINDNKITLFDTPGINFKDRKIFNRNLNKNALSTIDFSNIILHIVSIKGIKKEDNDINLNIKEIEAKKFLLINKIDLFSNRKDLAEYIASIPENFSSSYHEIIPISIKKNKNIKELLSLIDTNLSGQKNNISFSSYIPKDRNFYIEEYIREASINFLNLEIPYNIHINLEKIHERKNNFFISAEIITNKKSHMNIIIGKRASMLKKINIYARKLIKAYLKKDIFLELVVRYKENWKEAKDFLDTYK